MIIGLTGKRLAGKDTVANYLVEQKGFHHIFFSKKMKEAVAALFQIPVEYVDDWKDNRGGSLDRVEVHIDIGGIIKYTYGWVEFLQRFGTEMGREVLDEDLWVDLAFGPGSLEFFTEDYVIKDVRFENEAQRILDYGGKIIEIRRDMIDEENDSHISENGLPNHMVEYIIANTSTIESLYQDVDAILFNIECNDDNAI
jgi:hypothetical protein